VSPTTSRNDRSGRYRIPPSRKVRVQLQRPLLQLPELLRRHQHGEGARRRRGIEGLRFLVVRLSLRRFLGCLLLVGVQFGEQLPLVLFGFWTLKMA
jgi:hypothetical protein